MISAQKIRSFNKAEPSVDDIMCSLRAIARQPKAMAGETRKVLALARRFNMQVVAPHALEIDRRCQQDPSYLPSEIVEKANEWGFYSMWIPKLFGGRGYNFPSLSYFCEEIASACLGIANLIGVHYLGVAAAIATWNMRVSKKLCQEILAGEENGKPCIVSLAITEPGIGTDAEEKALLDKGDAACFCKPVPGGYEVTGTKVFISSAALSTWHLIIAYADLQKPSANSVWFIVKSGTRGFTVGRAEKKMGQKACPANELIFDDCFIPHEHVCIDAGQMKILSRSPSETYMQMIDYTVSATRAAVGGFGAGVSRAALKETIRFAAETKVAGAALIDQEWVQCRLADMYRNMVVARLLYVETNHANGLDGYFRLLQFKPLFYCLKLLHRQWIKKCVMPFLDFPAATLLMRKLMLNGQKNAQIHRTSGLASITKFTATDAGIQNCQMAIEIMGQAGLRQDRKVEKCLRDAKLLQIYEGTNQLNRLNTFKCLIHRHVPEAMLFEEGNALHT